MCIRDRMITVVDYKDLQAGNPAPVADLTDPMYPQGRLFLFYNTGNNHENEVRKGNGPVSYTHLDVYKRQT